MPENGRRKNRRTITARPGFQKARPRILPMQGYLRLLPIRETFSPATSVPSLPVYPARTTPGARYLPAAGFRRLGAYRRGDGSCPRDGGVCGHASHDCLRRARRRGRYRQVPPEGSAIPGFSAAAAPRSRSSRRSRPARSPLLCASAPIGFRRSNRRGHGLRHGHRAQTAVIDGRIVYGARAHAGRQFGLADIPLDELLDARGTCPARPR